MESSKPKPRSKSNVLHIGGIAVEFTYKPYGSQLAYMGRVISTLDRAQRDGHCNALLESPTGTGKSLSLLCSALAWQQNCASKALYGNLSHSKPDPEAFIDPLGHGGGFVPELEPSGNAAPAPATTNNKKQKKKTSPTIFYASRTHSQITQVIREYRKTAYRVPMAVLASRRHYCTNSLIRGEDNIDEKCKLLLKNREAREVGCQEFGNVNKVRAHPSLQKGGCHEAHDIEDLLKVGQIVKGCSYFAARDMADVAQIVFCPYSYIINPLIRKAMEVDIQGGIVIFDEAHNIEDIARDAGSIDVEEDVLSQLQMELANLRQDDSLTYEPLHEMIEGILSWMRRRKCTLEKHGFQNYVSCWTGDKALNELQEANLSRQCFPILQECAKKAIQTASDGEPEIAHLSGMAVNTLEGLFSSLNYFFSGNGLHILDYQLALQKYIKNGAGNPVRDWSYTLRLSCLNPAVVFKEIADLSLSVILTSGTLSPMSSFQSELGVRFETCLEAPHVINVDSQLWAAAISSGPGNYPLNASYKTAESYDFQDAIGKSLEEICKVVPGGCLVFFPSYKLMEKLCNRWSETGLWSRLNAEKPIFVEPRGSQEDFEPVLKGYYDAIHRGIKPMTERKRRGKKLDPTNHDAECSEKTKKGAAFLAVCRGKVSEGIDFSDENARVVIIVGIPFPNIYDLQVAQKKKFNDTYKSSKNLLSGNEWYCQQAFRALNQAAGRCIRHRFDYGAVIFLDERFRQERNLTYISKWLRRSIRHYDSFDQSLEGLKSFFKDDKVENTGNLIHPIDIEVVDHKDQRKLFTHRKNQKVSKANECSNELVSNGHIPSEMGEKLYRTPIIGTKYNCFPLKTESGAQTSRQTTEKGSIGCIEYIDLESRMKDDSRFSFPELMNLSPNGPQLSVVKETPSQSGSFPIPITLSDNDPELAIVKETPTRGYNVLAVSPETSEDEYSTSTIIQTEVPEQLLSYKLSSPSPMFACESIHSLGSPKIDVGADTIHYIPQAELSSNVSVNSRTQKRRKSLGSPLIKHLKQHLFDSPDSKTPIDAGFMESSIITTDASYRVISGHETTCSGSDTKGNNIPRSHAMDICETSSTAYGSAINKTLHLICSLCRHPLGLAENNYHVTCSLTFLSKVHLISLWKEKLDTSSGFLSSVSIFVCDISSVDQQFWGRAYEGSTGQGIWSKDDGCVFNTIFCPFCSNTENCIGLHVVAADSSNVQFLNKLLFYSDRLEAKEIKVQENKEISPSCTGGSALQDSIKKIAYAPQQQNSGGWRTTKSKMQLPKKG